MGTIATKFEIIDGISPIAQNITRALNMMNNNLRATQQACGQAMDTHAAYEFDRLIRETNAMLDQMEQNYRDVNNQQEALNRNMRSGSSAANALMSQIGNLVGAYAGLQGISAVADLSDTMVSNAARLGMVGEKYGTTDIDAIKQNIFGAAQNSRGDYAAMMNTVAKLGLTAPDAFSGTDDITRFAELVSKNLVVGGAGSTEQASAMYQLTQAMSSGRLQGDEYRSIIENAPLLAAAIEDYMIKVEGAKGTMKEWASEGLLTAEVIKKAVYNSADEVEARFESMPYTWGQTITTIKNQMIAASDPVLNIVNALAQNWKVAQTALMTVTTAVVAYKAAQFAANVQTATAAAQAAGQAGAKALLTGATATLTGATVEQTIAQQGLNAAMYASPAFLIVGLLTAVAGLALTTAMNIDTATDSLTDMEKEVKDYTKEYRNAVDSISHTSQSSFIEAERAMALYDSLDLLLGKTYLTVEESESLKTTYEQLAEIIPSINDLDMSSGAEKLNEELRKAVDNFYDLAVANAYYNAYSQKLEKTITEKIELEQQAATIEQSMINTPADMVVPNYISHTEYYDKYGISPVTGSSSKFMAWWEQVWSGNSRDGFGLGQGKIQDGYTLSENPEYYKLLEEYESLQSAIASATDDEKDFIEKMLEYREKSIAFDNEFGTDLDQIVVNTEKTVEHLEHVLNLAEREAINRFTTARVEIDMSGMTNKIESEEDFDGFLGLFAEGLTEALSVAAEKAEE